jgi:hypothetical protein
LKDSLPGRWIARCKQHGALATRYDKRGESFYALWVIAMTIVWLGDKR